MTWSDEVKTNWNSVFTLSIGIDRLEQTDQGLQCLSLIQLFLNKSTANKMDLFKLLDKYGKKLRYPNI